MSRDKYRKDLKFTKNRLRQTTLTVTCPAIGGGGGAIFTFTRWVKIYSLYSYTASTVVYFPEEISNEILTTQLTAGATGTLVNFRNGILPEYVIQMGVEKINFFKPIVTRQIGVYRNISTAGTNNISIFYL